MGLRGFFDALAKIAAQPEKDFGELVRQRRRKRGLPVAPAGKVLPFPPVRRTTILQSLWRSMRRLSAHCTRQFPTAHAGEHSGDLAAITSVTRTVRMTAEQASYYRVREPPAPSSLDSGVYISAQRARQHTLAPCLTIGETSPLQRGKAPGRR
jgi:hypothetical protein